MKKRILPYFIFTITLLLLFYSCKKETIVFQDNFDSNSNQWDTLQSTYMYNKIENGKLIMSSKIDNIFNLSLVRSDFLNKNISLTASIKVEKFYDQDGAAGMILFADNQKNPKNYIFFGINNKNEVAISKESSTPELAQTYYKNENKAYRPGQANEFSIVTSENTIHFLINQTPIVAINRPKHSGDYYGFIVLDSKIIADDLIVKSSSK